MDKPSERKLDYKKWGDTDVGSIRDYGAGGKRQQQDGLWDKPTTITGGSADQRLRESNYCKEAHAKSDKKKGDSLGDLLDKALNDTGGPPFCNTGVLKGRVF